MDLPTYTNIWRIEKRLYKLYDFRLPAPLPINWIAVFTGITVPYILLLVAVGLPFNHNLVWLYVLPPGLLTWLTTRPVIESKRLPELLESQIRYLAEPRVWCRMAPLAEKDHMAVTARVWHSHRVARRRAPSVVTLLERGSLARRKPAIPLRPAHVPALAAQLAASPVPDVAAGAAAPADHGTAVGATLGTAGASGGVRERGRAGGTAGGRAGDGSAGAGPGRRKAVAALASGQAAPAPPLPSHQASRPAGMRGSAPLRPAAAPVLATMPEHAAPAAFPVLPRTGDAVPAPGIPAAPAVPAVQMLPGTAEAPWGTRSPARGAAGSTPPAGPVPGAEAPPAGVRARGTSGGAPRIEVAHSGPAHRPVPDERPASPARAWPMVGPSRPLQPGRQPGPRQPAPAQPSRPSHVQPPSAQAPAAGAAEGPAKPEPPASWPAGRTPRHQELFSLLASKPAANDSPPHPSPATAAPSEAAAPVVAEVVAAAEVVAPAAVEGKEATGHSAAAVDPVLVVRPEVVAGEPARALSLAVPAVPAGQARVPVAAPVEPAPAALALPAVPAVPPVAVPPAPVPPAPVPPAAAPAVPAAQVVAAAPVAPAPAALPPVPAAPVPSVSAVAVPPVSAAPLPPVAAPPLPPVPAAPVPPAAPQGPGTARERSIPSIERALSGPSRGRNLSWQTKVKVVAGAGQGPGARDQEALDRSRARLPLRGPKRVLILGCTSGAGQTVTALMTGHILASLREVPVAAVDLHDGTLAGYAAPAARVREVLDGAQPQGQPSAPPDGLPPHTRAGGQRVADHARLDVIASDDPLRDGDERRLAELLGRHYPLTILDPGATGLTRLLKITDQLVIVAPASIEAASALADTRDWLNAHGFSDLAMHSVTLINGVSRRSLPDVEAAEAVARGRCRAIVRVPWDDMLPVGVSGPSTLHPQTRVSYTALAGVLVAGMAAAPVRRPQ